MRVLGGVMGVEEKPPFHAERLQQGADTPSNPSGWAAGNVANPFGNPTAHRIVGAIEQA